MEDSSSVSPTTQEDQIPSISAAYSSIEPGERLLTAHETAGTVGSRAVPFLVALAHADQAAVAHVDGNQQLFPGFGGNSALAEDHLLRVDIVVDGSKLFDLSQPHTAQDHIGHGLAVEHSKALCDAHVVDIILKQLSFYIE